MSFVVDASFAAAWLMAEAHSDIAENAIGGIKGRAPVPPLFWDETRNIVVLAERRQRIAPGEAIAAMKRLRKLPLVTVPTNRDEEVLRLAATHSLSAYDAVYLETAISVQRPLATLDRALARAARASQVGVIGPYA